MKTDTMKIYDVLSECAVVADFDYEAIAEKILKRLEYEDTMRVLRRSQKLLMHILSEEIHVITTKDMAKHQKARVEYLRSVTEDNSHVLGFQATTE